LAEANVVYDQTGFKPQLSVHVGNVSQVVIAWQTLISIPIVH